MQPVFNRDVIAGLSDSAASSLQELDAWINGEEFIESRDPMDIQNPVATSQATMTNLESELIAAVTHPNNSSMLSLISQLESYPDEDRKMAVTTAFLRTIPDASLESLTMLLNTGLVDINHTDEITDRGSLHEAALAGRFDVLKLCLDHGTISRCHN